MYIQLNGSKEFLESDINVQNILQIAGTVGPPQLIQQVVELSFFFSREVVNALIH